MFSKCMGFASAQRGGAIASDATLTIGSGITIQSGAGSGGGTVGDATLGLTNQGLISANTGGGTITVTGTNWVNDTTGVLRANGATLAVAYEAIVDVDPLRRGPDGAFYSLARCGIKKDGGVFPLELSLTGLENGGMVRVTRSQPAAAAESCSICHGPGAEFDTAAVHK